MRDERNRFSLQTRRTTIAMETLPPIRRSRAVAVAPALVRKAAPMWLVARLSRLPGPAAGLARPRRPEAPAPSRTTLPPYRRTSTWLDGRTAPRENSRSQRSAERQRVAMDAISPRDTISKLSNDLLLTASGMRNGKFVVRGMLMNPRGRLNMPKKKIRIARRILFTPMNLYKWRFFFSDKKR